MGTKIKKLLEGCKCGVYIQVNAHRDMYITAKDKIEEIGKQECRPNIPIDILKKMIETNTVIELQFYPDTLIGSYTVYHYDLEAALDLALELLAAHEH